MAALGVSRQTMRKWDEEGLLKPTEITLGGHWRYDLSKIQTPRFRPIGQPPRESVAYVTLASAAISWQLRKLSLSQASSHPMS